MMKIVAIAVVGLAFASPAFAQEMKCDQDTIAKVQAAVDATADAAKKDAGAAEVKKASDAMAANKADECVAALTAASEAIK